jgi:hypothetical protein
VHQFRAISATLSKNQSPEAVKDLAAIVSADEYLYNLTAMQVSKGDLRSAGEEAWWAVRTTI